MRTFLLTAALLLSCGSPNQPGVQCIGEAVCYDEKSALFCQGGVFSQPFACPGPNGCLANSSRVICDFNGSKVGTACPAQQQGNGLCQGDQLLKCTDAGWTLTPCKSCHESNGQLFCG